MWVGHDCIMFLFLQIRLHLTALYFAKGLKMTASRAVVIASLAMLAAGCATDTRLEKKPSAAPVAVALTGANGDMSKYLGTWTSNCGREYRVTPDGKGAFSSGTNSFNFTSISGNTVEGTLAIDTHETPDCSGSPKRTSAKIRMSYVGQAAVGSSFGEGTLFTGSADKLAAILAGASGTTEGNVFNIGFLDGFSKFQLAPAESFSATNLVYTKKP